MRPEAYADEVVKVEVFRQDLVRLDAVNSAIGLDAIDRPPSVGCLFEDVVLTRFYQRERVVRGASVSLR